LGEVVGSTPYYLLDDALGSIRDVTTATPVNTVFSSNYEPYGHSYGLTQSLAIFNFEYTHKPYDTATGFYYFGARYYDPAIERFVTEDSMMYSMNIQNPLSLNRYIYAMNNPETFNDPDGHMIGFPDHYGSYNDLLQVEEEENIDVGITLTEDVQEQNGEESSTTSSSTTVVTSESPTTVTTTTSVTTTATSGSTIRGGVRISEIPWSEIGAYAVSSVFIVGGPAIIVFGAPAAAVFVFLTTGDPGAALQAGEQVGVIGEGVFDSGLDAAAYTAREGPNATPVGAWNTAISNLPGESLQNEANLIDQRMLSDVASIFGGL
jgi:RHS repeat-associated protein